MPRLHRLVQTFPLISDQISPTELSVVLGEFERVLDQKIQGAIVEFGCFAGTTSLFIRRILQERRDAREFHVYDSFEGLPSKNMHDENAAGIEFAAGELAISKRQFIKNFERAQLQLPIIHKAWFDQLHEKDLPDSIAFAFLDGDFYDSILTSLELVWPRMGDNGTILVHDYNRETLPGVARALATFGQRHSNTPVWREEANIAIGRLKS